MSFSERGEALLAKLRQDRLSAKIQKPFFGPVTTIESNLPAQWCDKLNTQLNKVPKKNVESNVSFYSEALDLGIAFQEEALSLGYTFKGFREEAELDTSKIKNLSETINCSSPFYAFSMLILLMNSTAKLWADEELDVCRYYKGLEKQKQAAREQVEDFLVKLHEAVESGVWDDRRAKDEEEYLEAESQKSKPVRRRAALGPRSGGNSASRGGYKDAAYILVTVMRWRDYLREALMPRFGLWREHGVRSGTAIT